MMAQLLMVGLTEVMKANEEYKKEARELRRQNEELKIEEILIKEWLKHMKNLGKQKRNLKKNNVVISGLSMEKLKGITLAKAIDEEENKRM